MPKRRELKRRTRVLVIDGEVHVVVERGLRGIATKRLVGTAKKRALEALDDAQYDIAASVIGTEKPPP